MRNAAHGGPKRREPIGNGAKQEVKDLFTENGYQRTRTGYSLPMRDPLTSVSPNRKVQPRQGWR